DYAGAITAWRAVLSENPNDRAATLALVDALSEDGELEIAYAELEQLLGQTEGEGRGPILAKLGEIATRAGALPQALSHYKELLTGPDISAELLARIEGVAEQLGAGDVIQNVLERRIRATEPAEERMLLLDRAGANALERLN